MGIAIDVVLLLIMALCIISGARRGLVRSIMNSITLIAAVAGAWFFYPPLASYYYSSLIHDSLSAGVTAKLDSLLSSGAQTIDLSSLFADRPAAFTQLFELYGVDISAMEDKYYKLIDSASENVTGALSEAIAQPVSDALSNILAFITIFFGIIILLMIVAALLDLIFKLPVLSPINRAGGVVFGILTGAAGVIVSALLISAACPLLAVIFPDVFNAGTAQSSAIVKLVDSIDFDSLLGSLRVALSM